MALINKLRQSGATDSITRCHVTLQCATHIQRSPAQTHPALMQPAVLLPLLLCRCRGCRGVKAQPLPTAATPAHCCGKTAAAACCVCVCVWKVKMQERWGIVLLSKIWLQSFPLSHSLCLSHSLTQLQTMTLSLDLTPSLKLTCTPPPEAVQPAAAVVGCTAVLPAVPPGSLHWPAGC